MKFILIFCAKCVFIKGNISCREIQNKRKFGKLNIQNILRSYPVDRMDYMEWCMVQVHHRIDLQLQLLLLILHALSISDTATA